MIPEKIHVSDSMKMTVCDTYQQLIHLSSCPDFLKYVTHGRVVLMHSAFLKENSSIATID